MALLLSRRSILNPSASLSRQVHIIWDLYEQKLLIGFIDEPKINWDIEMRIGIVHLPDWLEDTLPAWIVAKVLKGHTPDNPLRIDFDFAEVLATMIREKVDAIAKKTSDRKQSIAPV